MESITIHFGPKKVSSEDDEASTKKKDDEEETFKGPKGRTNVWWKDVKYTPPKKTGPAKRVNLWWKRDLKKSFLMKSMDIGVDNGKLAIFARYPILAIICLSMILKKN